MAKEKKPFYKRAWFIILVIILVLGAIGAPKDSENGTESNESNSKVTESEKLPDTTEETVAVTEAKKPEIEVTADELIDVLNNNALKASSTYKDKYIKVTGKVANIDSSGKYFTLNPLSSDFNLTNVMCNISKDQIEIVSNFDKNQTVTVIGTVSLVGEVLGYTIEVETIE